MTTLPKDIQDRFKEQQFVIDSPYEAICWLWALLTEMGDEFDEGDDLIDQANGTYKYQSSFGSKPSAFIEGARYQHSLMMPKLVAFREELNSVTKMCMDYEDKVTEKAVDDRVYYKTKLDQERANVRRRDEALAKFRLWGSDGCPTCETGRITLYVANSVCIKCNPALYDPPKAISEGEGK